MSFKRLISASMLLAGCASPPTLGTAVEQPVNFYRADCRSTDDNAQLAASLKADMAFCAAESQGVALREPVTADALAPSRAKETSRFACMVQRDYFIESASRNWSRCALKKMGV